MPPQDPSVPLLINVLFSFDSDSRDYNLSCTLELPGRLEILLLRLPFKSVKSETLEIQN